MELINGLALFIGLQPASLTLTHSTNNSTCLLCELSPLLSSASLIQLLFFLLGLVSFVAEQWRELPPLTHNKLTQQEKQSHYSAALLFSQFHSFLREMEKRESEWVNWLVLFGLSSLFAERCGSCRP